MTLTETLRHRWYQWKNARIYRRLPVSIPVKVTVKSTGATFQETLLNWSPGGVFISTPTPPLPLEELVDLEFNLGSSDSVLKLKGQVVRHQMKHGEGFPDGVGIMFVDFTQSGVFLLRDLLLGVFPKESSQPSEISTTSSSRLPPGV